MTRKSAHRLRRDERGLASLELVAMLPLLLVFVLLVLQTGLILWTIGTTNEAVRQGARAASLGRDGCGAARDILGNGLTVVRCTARGGALAPATLDLVVQVPVFGGAGDYLPPMRVSRSVDMP